MKKIILLLASFFCIANVDAQTSVKDSLKTLLQNEIQDTSKVLLLNELSFVYYESQPDTAMLLASEALTLSQQIGFVKGEALSLVRMGAVYDIRGNKLKAMQVYVQALKLNEEINNSAGMAAIFNNIGGIYKEQGNQHQAIEYYLKAKKLNEQLKLQKEITRTLLNLGSSYAWLKQFDTARVYTQQAYEVSRKINYHRLTGFALTQMGKISSQTDQKKLALEYYRLSIPYLKLSENYVTLIGTFMGMARLFDSEGQGDSTLLYANYSFQLCKSLGHQLSPVSSFLYSYYKKRGKIDSALFYIEIAKSNNDSLYNRQKIIQLQTLVFDEKVRQNEIEESRKHNLQFAALAIGLITFIILFFALSRSIIVKTKFIEFFGVLGLLAVFEFINLFIHPYLAHLTNDSPVWMLLILIAIGAMLVPLHHKLEKWITKVMVEKNKNIRLDAAKKTIAILEPK